MTEEFANGQRQRVRPKTDRRWKKSRRREPSSSPELEKFVRGQLEMLSISSPRTTVRITARSAMRSLDAGTDLPEEPAGNGQNRSAPVFVVAADKEQQASVDGLVQKLKESGISVQGVDVLSVAREA